MPFGFVAGALDVGEVAEEGEEHGFEEVPVVGAAGEEGGEPGLRRDDGIQVDAGEVAVAAGGDVET